MTAVFTVGQALTACGLGADYAAPYLGRLEDAGQPGLPLFRDMAKVLVTGGATTRLLVASLRSVQPVVDLAVLGLDTFTINPRVAAELLDCRLTEQAAAEFQRAALAMGDES